MACSKPQDEAAAADLLPTITELLEETLTEEVNRHRNGAESNDDLTMFCLRVS